MVVVLKSEIPCLRAVSLISFLFMILLGYTPLNALAKVSLSTDLSKRYILNGLYYSLLSEFTGLEIAARILW